MPDERVEELQKETGFPEEVIGCYLSNYKVPHVCPIALVGWCKEYVRCRLLEEVVSKLNCDIGGQQWKK